MASAPPAPQLPPVNTVPSTQVSLILKAEGLRKKDYLTESDPVCIIYYQEGRLIGLPTGRKTWKEVARTERIRNTKNPEWSKNIVVDYFFEERQTLRFDIYDWDTEELNSPLDEHDFLGSMECDLAEIVSNGTFTRAIKRDNKESKKDYGTLTITCEEIDEGMREIIEMRISATNLDKKDKILIFGKSDPYMQVYRQGDNGQTLIYRTEFLLKNLNPVFAQFELCVKQLCGGDTSKNVRFECWDNDDDKLSKHDFIGSCDIPVREMQSDTAISIVRPLINEKKAAKKGSSYKNSGIMTLQCRRIFLPTFLDFIAGGTQLDFSVAVDFTASNGAVHKPSSLHFITSTGIPNQYEIAIKAVLEICQHYNNSKLFDAYGFGAKINDSAKMIPIFSLVSPSTTLTNPAVVGVDGVLYAYRNCINTVKLHGPTNFSPIIHQAMRATCQKNTHQGARYHILLIITDGSISDMETTKKAIIEAAGLPLSIIIVGVGNDDFQKMDELDGDDQRLTAGGRTAERDIVQFVPIRKFIGIENQHIPDVVIARLAKEVLAEVPLQLTSYMRRHNIQPRSSDDPWPRDPPAVPLYQPPVNPGPVAAPQSYYYPGGGSTNGYVPQLGPPPVGFAPMPNQAPNGAPPYPGPAAPYPPGQFIPQQGYQPPPMPGSNYPGPPPPSAYGQPHPAPYPPPDSNGYQSNDGVYPYSTAPYMGPVNNGQNYGAYPYPTYPQPQNGGSGHNSARNGDTTASAPPVSIDDLQMSFSRMPTSR